MRTNQNSHLHLKIGLQFLSVKRFCILVLIYLKQLCCEFRMGHYLYSFKIYNNFKLLGEKLKIRIVIAFKYHFKLHFDIHLKS